MVTVTIELPQSENAQVVIDQMSRVSEGNMSTYLGMNVSVAQPASLQSSTSTLISQVLTMRTVDCFHGHWCAAGVVTPCDQDFYNPYIDQNTPNACLRCPDYSHTEGTATVHKSSVYVTQFERVYELLNSTYNERDADAQRGVHLSRG